MVLASRSFLSALLLAPLACTQALLGDAVRVSWDPNPEPDITKYSVYYGEPGRGQTSIVTVTNGTTAIVSGLLEGHAYVFYVTAWNSAGLESDPSDSVSYDLNAWPGILPIPDQPVQIGSLFTFTPIGYRRPPGQTLRFTLLPGAPPGASLDAATGVFTWTPSAELAGSTNTIGIRVIDSSIPPRNRTATFNIIVEAPDSDGDGIPDWAELEAGTNPYDRTSLLQITSLSDLGTDVAIHFTAVPGKSYRVESTDVSPQGLSWHVLADNVAATGSIETVIDPGGYLVPTRFYRVGLASASVPILSAPYGFTTLRAAGRQVASKAPNYTTTAPSYLGLPLTRPILYHGTIDGVQGSRIDDSRADWADGEFEGSNGPHYLEITSGPYAGLTADIQATESATKSLVLSRDLSGLAAGTASYVIRPHWTLASIFGPHDESGLGTIADGPVDLVRLLDPLSQTRSYYRYQVVGLGGVGWRSYVDFRSDQSNIVIAPGQGFGIHRNRPEDLVFTVSGTFKTGITAVEILPGLNIVANILPVDISLGDSGLYTGDPTTGLAGGSEISADQVLIYDSDPPQVFYYQTFGPGGSGWRSTADPSVDVSSIIIRSGSSFGIQRRTAPGFVWIIQSKL